MDVASRSIAHRGRRRPTLRTGLKAIAVAALGSPFRISARLRKLAETDLVTILNLHQVHPEPSAGRAALSVELFDELLGFVSRHFDVRTFATLDQPNRRPRLILSFDDGYRDFIEYAVPLLEKYKIAANQNVIPANIESGLPPLNVLARQFVAEAPASLADRIEIIGIEGKLSEIPLQTLSNFLKWRSQAEQQTLGDILIPKILDWHAFKPIAMMSAEEIRQISNIHEIGGHSFDHASMAFESDAFLQSDVARCQAYFTEKLGQAMTIYAFPNGSCRLEQIELVRDAGIDHVLLAGRGFDSGGPVHTRHNFDAASSREVRVEALGGRERITR